MPHAKLTKSFVDNIPFLEKGQAFYRDTACQGFGLCVGKTTKTYVAERWVNGKSIRVTLGKHGQITPEQARKRAAIELGKMSAGENPNLTKKIKRIEHITLQKAFEEFLATRGSLKERTVSDYKRAMNVAFRDWKNKAINAISKDMVYRKHARLGEESGHAQANQAMRFLRALFSFAMGKYETLQGQPLILNNPVRVLTETKAWFRVDRRRTVIKNDEIAPWFQAVNNLTDSYSYEKAETVRDYLLLLIFTGLRRQEAMKLQWADVDLQAKTLTIPDTKNREPLILPLSEFVFDLLSRRKQKTINEYVFPGDGKTGHLIEPKRQILKVTEESGVKFCLHDLRRTFVTVAESLDIPAYALKRLLNHKINGDVTAGYIVSDAERLRKPMQKIADRLLFLAHQKPPAKVVNIKN